MKTLHQQTSEFTESFVAEVPAEALATMNQAKDDLEKTGIVATSLQVGDEAPNFTLPNHQGEPTNLKSLLQKGPVVISFYRGGWCPYCNLQLAALQQALPEIQATGASFVAITPETPDHTLTTAQKHALEFTVLSDARNAVAQQFGLKFVVAENLRPLYASFGIDLPATNGDDTFTLPLPATFVIGTDQKVTYRFVDHDYSQRAEPADIVQALSKSSA